MVSNRFIFILLYCSDLHKLFNIIRFLPDQYFNRKTVIMFSFLLVVDSVSLQWQEWVREIERCCQWMLVYFDKSKKNKKRNEKQNYQQREPPLTSTLLFYDVIGCKIDFLFLLFFYFKQKKKKSKIKRKYRKRILE